MNIGTNVGGSAIGALSGDLPYMIANPISNNPGALWWNWGEAVTPFVKATPADGVDMIWTDERVAELNNGFKTIDDQIAALEAQKREVYRQYDNMA